MCSLPAVVGDDDLKPADWAFGANPPTVAKAIVRFAMQLYLSITVGDPKHGKPFRHILPDDALRPAFPIVPASAEPIPAARVRSHTYNTQASPAPTRCPAGTPLQLLPPTAADSLSWSPSTAAPLELLELCYLHFR